MRGVIYFVALLAIFWVTATAISVVLTATHFLSALLTFAMVLAGIHSLTRAATLWYLKPQYQEMVDRRSADILRDAEQGLTPYV